MARARTLDFMRGSMSLRHSAKHGSKSLRRSADHGFTNLKRSAEHGFTNLTRSAEHGFTLIELMVVITIIGLASAAVVLALPDPRGRLADEASRFAVRVRAAHDLAIIESRPVSVWVTAGGYGFDEWAGGWRAMADTPFRVERWGKDTSVPFADRARVIFDTTGMTERPLTVPFARDRVRTSVTIDTDGSVRVDG